MKSRYALTIFVCGVALSACNGPASLSSSGVVPPQSQQAMSRIDPAATPTPIPFSFQTVDNPSSNVNAVTGINLLNQIVGTIGNGTPSSPLESYTAAPPYTSFTPVVYANAQATVAMALSSSASHPIIAGYVVKPPSLRGTWAGVLINGLWTVFKYRKEGIGNYSITELLGFNDAEYAVGFFVNNYGNQIPVIVSVPNEKFNLLKPPGATNAAGTGINDLNHIAGWESNSSGVVGFFLRAGVYYTFAYPSATATEALSLNQQDQIVGYYQGSKGIKHGFILTGPTGQPVWQTVDEPNAVNGTVVTGINANDDICGYYIDGNGVQHGFIAVPKPGRS
jgi:hypothetical protein